MRVHFVTCDVFTATRYAGNPLLVVPDATGLTTEQMQRIAREINYSESTFVLPPKDPANAYLQRTFVPVREIPYAGHPTVGTAVVLASRGRIPASGGITIEVGFGPLHLELAADGGGVRVRMEQGKPAWDPPLTGELRERVASALSLPVAGLHPELPPRLVSTGNRFLIVPLADKASVSCAEADVRAILALQNELSALGIYLFSFDGDRVRSRAFCPDAGVPEDPATGSAAGPLGVYLALHGALPRGGGPFVIDQGVEMGRPSELTVEAFVDADGAPRGVTVAGTAVLMMEGTIEAA